MVKLATNLLFKKSNIKDKISDEHVIKKIKYQ